MTRLQQSAMMRPVFPLVMVLFLIITPSLEKTEKIWGILAFLIIMLPFIWYSSRKEKAVIKEGGTDLDELEAQISMRSYKTAYSALFLYMIPAMLEFETVLEKTADTYASKIDMLFLFGGWLTAEICRTIAIWYYTNQPEKVSNKLKYPG